MHLSFIKDKEKDLKTEFKNNFVEFTNIKKTYSAFFWWKEFYNNFSEKNSMVWDILPKEKNEEKLLNL